MTRPLPSFRNLSYAGFATTSKATPMPDPRLDWRDDVPVSTQYDDPYFSLHGGLAETRHVFLDGNDLPARFQPGFHIAELGFGTGLNVLAALQAWIGSKQPGKLHVTSFEAYPVSAATMIRALSAFPELDGPASQLADAWAAGARSIALRGLQLDVIEGAAETTLPAWPGKADAWFLDGFAPSRNPALWSPEILRQVADHTRPGGTAATYTAAGHVRRALGEAGFTVTRHPGYGRKRHMTRATLGG